jgi:hypothetical protein
MIRSKLFYRALWLLFAVVTLSASATFASACPFCAAETRTLSEEINLTDAAVVAKLAGPKAADLDSGNAKFQIVKVLSGEDVIGDAKQIETVFFGDPNTKQLFLITGIGTDYTEWATPLPLSDAALEYMGRLVDVPESGADRLAFFQEYLENSDPLLGQDAYEEFARASYADVHELKPRMKHDLLVKWIKDPETNPTRRRLYLTMLGVCGSKADLPMLEEMIVSGYEDKRPFIEPMVAGGLAMGGPLELPTWAEFVRLDERRKKLGLDALIACYMVLRGPEGLNLIDERLLTPRNVEYSYVYSTIMALRFLGEETQVVPRPRLLASMRLLLENPEFADQVIVDLARWEDWSVLERLVTMFKTSDKNGYVRPPVVAYLLSAMEQPGAVGVRAAAAMSELEQLDSEVVKRARATAAFGFLQRARPAAASSAAERSQGGEAASKQTVPATEPGRKGLSASAGDSADKESGGQSASADVPPDPAKFGQGPGVEGRDEVVVTPTTGGEKERVTQAAIATVSPAAQAASPGPARAVVVVGLPAGSMVLLTGVYWAILRCGAV